MSFIGGVAAQDDMGGVEFSLSGDWCSKAPLENQDPSAVDGYNACVLNYRKDDAVTKFEIRNCADGVDDGVCSSGSIVNLGKYDEYMKNQYIGIYGGGAYYRTSTILTFNEDKQEVEFMRSNKYYIPDMFSMWDEDLNDFQFLSVKEECKPDSSGLYPIDAYVLDTCYEGPTLSESEKMQVSKKLYDYSQESRMFWDAYINYGKGESVGKTDTNPSEEQIEENVLAYYQDNVDYLLANNLAKGFSDGKFWANRSITRGEFSTILANALDFRGLLSEDIKNNCSGEGVNGLFVDVDSSNVHSEGICIMKHEDVIRGYGDGSEFRPDEYVTYDQAAKMVLRSLKGSERPVDAQLSGYVEDLKDMGYETPTFKGVGDDLMRGEMAFWIHKLIVS